MKTVSLLLSLLLGAAWAQNPTGQITGTINDQSGAVIAGAVVTAQNKATNLTRTSTTNEEGVFNIPALPPGVYDVTVDAKGFPKQVRAGVEIQVGVASRLDFSVAVGNVAETIRVEGGAPLIQTETTEIGQVIENKRIVELPLNGRNYLQLASLIPGATTNGPASSQGQQRMGGARNSFALNVAGQRVHYNHYTLDGIENTDPNFNTYLMLPSLDALQEFKVEAGIFQAEYGRAIAQINISTKSGTNALHGSLFEFLRNSKMDAKNYFDRGDAPIPPFKRNQFGATVSGPVIKNRLFWLFSYEGLRERKALTQTGVVPTAADRAGDFSPRNLTIIDPLTKTAALPGGTPFAGARIPDNRLAPISRRVLTDFYPLPNLNTGGATNFINNEGRRSDNDQYHGRLDFTQNDRSSWFFRASASDDLQYIPAFAPNTGNNNIVEAKQGVLANTRLLGANKVNEFRVSINRFVSQNIQQRANTTNVVQTLGIPDVDTSIPLFWGIPVFQINGFGTVGECNDCPFVNWNTTYQVKDDMSWTKGRHSLKFGVEGRQLRFNQVGAVVPRGRFNFGGNYTNYGMADFMLGFMNNSEGQVGAPIATFYQTGWSLYLQDSWKVTPKLTVNAGIRWEFEPPFYDKHDNIVNVDFKNDFSAPPTFVRLGTGDPYAGNPPFRLPASIPYVRDGRFGRHVSTVDKNDFAPRLGIAYQLTPKTVIRSGAGIYYVRDIGNGSFDIVRNAPFTIRRNEPGNATIPNLSWQRPFTITGAPTFILASQYEPSAYIAQWSFGVQQEIAQNMSLEVTYLGSAGSHLRRLGSYNDPAPAPGNVQANRPFNQIGSIQVMYAPSHSNYHALQMAFKHRFANGFTTLSSYSWSKSIDNGSGIRTTDGDFLTPTNFHDINNERGRSAFDFRQRSTTSFLYELPFGKGKRWGNSLVSAANYLLGGWQIGGILTLQSGFPLTIGCGGGVVQNGGSGCRPDSVPGEAWDLGRGRQDPTRWFNTGAFIDRLDSPRLGQAGVLPTTYRFGTSGRNIVDGPGIMGFDFNVQKAIAIKEGMRAEFRAEFFNLPNHPIWGNPGTGLRTPTYGVITGTRIDPRDVQLALRFVF